MVFNDGSSHLYDSSVFGYLDDIVVYTDTETQHLERLKEVFQLFRFNQLFLKPSKCFFLRPEVNFCGFIVSKGRIVVEHETDALTRSRVNTESQDWRTLPFTKMTG